MITIEDVLKQINNRFKLIQVAAKRARKLSVYGSHALVDWGNNSPIIVALREIACGYKFDDKGNYVFRDLSNLKEDDLKKNFNIKNDVNNSENFSFKDLNNHKNMGNIKLIGLGFSDNFKDNI